MQRIDSVSVSDPDIVVTDLTPFQRLRDEDQQWLQALAKEADCNALSLHFGRSRDVDRSPVVSWDWESGQWWAGRFVGELTFQGRTIRIEPRFGMPMLYRWLSRIWGIRVLPSTGRYASGRIWLWELIARIWTNRLLVASKHGLPFVRADERHIGSTLRGKLQVVESASLLRAGQLKLASRTRNRIVDPRLGGFLLGAFTRLAANMGHHRDERSWLTERGYDLVQDLRAKVSRQQIVDACRYRGAVRYTPITESYRSAIELSRSLLANRPLSSTAAGGQRVFGVLLDMAEIFELYLFHLIRDLLPHTEVAHLGRAECSMWLLQGRTASDQIAGLKPDIMIRCDSHRWIVDAKYKITTPSSDRPEGIHREDVYQLAAYLSTQSADRGRLDGMLVYPMSQQVHRLHERGPFGLARTGAKVSFLGLDCESPVPAQAVKLTTSELAFGNALQRTMMS